MEPLFLMQLARRGIPMFEIASASKKVAVLGGIPLLRMLGARICVWMNEASGLTKPFVVRGCLNYGERYVIVDPKLVDSTSSTTGCNNTCL